MTGTLLAVLASYLLGGVPFSALAARIKGVDLRQHGSGNLGATNAIRVLGPALGVPVLILDIAKGWVSAAVFPDLLGATAPEAGLLCGIGAVVGHIWPVWTRFRGGKGVAAAAGAFLALAPAATGIAAATFVVVLLISRYMSLASMIGGISLPVALVLTNGSRPLVVAGVGIAALILVRHRSNLGRIRDGTESRVPLGRKRGTG